MPQMRQDQFPEPPGKPGHRDDDEGPGRGVQDFLQPANRMVEAACNRSERRFEDRDEPVDPALMAAAMASLPATAMPQRRQMFRHDDGCDAEQHQKGKGARRTASSDRPVPAVVAAPLTRSAPGCLSDSLNRLSSVDLACHAPVAVDHIDGGYITARGEQHILDRQAGRHFGRAGNGTARRLHDVAKFQHLKPRDIADEPADIVIAGFSSNSAARPCWIIRPSRMIAMRSARRTASEKSCVTNRIVFWSRACSSSNSS